MNPLNNIILIGMPGSGKSTVGRRLAATLKLDFVDTDDIICDKYNMPLCRIIEKNGVEAVMRIEDEVVCGFECENSVVATGGSVVLYPAAMAHLAKLGKIVYLKTDFKQISSRIKNLTTRGIVFKPGQTLADINAERVPLYEKYADITVDEGDKSLQQCIQSICDQIR